MRYCAVGGSKCSALKTGEKQLSFSHFLRRMPLVTSHHGLGRLWEAFFVFIHINASRGLSLVILVFPLQNNNKYTNYLIASLLFYFTCALS